MLKLHEHVGNHSMPDETHTSATPSAPKPRWTTC